MGRGASSSTTSMSASRQVLKLDSPVRDLSKSKNVSAPSNLSMNQTLEGHHGAVMCVTWNANYRKVRPETRACAVY